MLKVVRNPKFTAPVTVHQPGDGGQIEGRFKVQYRALTKSEVEAHDMTTADGASVFLRDVVQGWEGLVDDEKQPFEFNDENFSLLLDLTHFRVALITTYFSSTNGVKAAKRGN